MLGCVDVFDHIQHLCGNLESTSASGCWHNVRVVKPCQIKKVVTSENLLGLGEARASFWMVSTSKEQVCMPHTGRK